MMFGLLQRPTNSGSKTQESSSLSTCVLLTWRCSKGQQAHSSARARATCRHSPRTGRKASYAFTNYYGSVTAASDQPPSRGGSPRPPVVAPPARPAPSTLQAVAPGSRLGSHVVPISPERGIRTLGITTLALLSVQRSAPPPAAAPCRHEPKPRPPFRGPGRFVLLQDGRGGRI